MNKVSITTTIKRKILFLLCLRYFTDTIIREEWRKTLHTSPKESLGVLYNPLRLEIISKCLLKYKELKIRHKVTVGSQISSIPLRYCPPPALSLTNVHVWRKSTQETQTLLRYCLGYIGIIFPHWKENCLFLNMIVSKYIMEWKFRSQELVCSRLKMPLKNSSPESRKSIFLVSEERL